MDFVILRETLVQLQQEMTEIDLVRQETQKTHRALRSKDVHLNVEVMELLRTAQAEIAVVREMDVGQVITAHQINVQAKVILVQVQMADVLEVTTHQIQLIKKMGS